MKLNLIYHQDYYLRNKKEAYVFLGGNLKFETKLENGNQKPSPMGSVCFIQEQEQILVKAKCKLN